MSAEDVKSENLTSQAEAEVEAENAEENRSSNSSAETKADAGDDQRNSLLDAGEEEEEASSNNILFAQHPASQLTDEEITMLEALFNQMNTNGDGILKPKELAEAMNSVGAEVDEETLKRQLRMEASEEEGINIDDFIHMMAIHMKRKLTEDDVQLAFSAFDLNQDGYIDAEELQQAMNHIGFQMTPAEVAEMIADADKNGDGKIDFDEFKEKMLLFGAACGTALVGGAGATGEQSGSDAEAAATEVAATEVTAADVAAAEVAADATAADNSVSA